MSRHFQPATAEPAPFGSTRSPDVRGQVASEAVKLSDRIEIAIPLLVMFGIGFGVVSL